MEYFNVFLRVFNSGLFIFPLLLFPSSLVTFLLTCSLSLSVFVFEQENFTIILRILRSVFCVHVLMVIVFCPVVKSKMFVIFLVFSYDAHRKRLFKLLNLFYLFKEFFLSNGLVLGGFNSWIYRNIINIFASSINSSKLVSIEVRVSRSGH